MPRKRRAVKRADGEGTLVPRKDKDGKIIGWKGAVTVGFDLKGKSDRRWVSGKTPDVVREKMETIKHARNTNMLSSKDKITVTDYLTRWLNFKKNDGVKLKTIDDYQRVVEKRLKPVFGKFKLEKLKPLDVESGIQTIREGSTIQEARRALGVFSMAMNQAVRWEIVPRNVCQAVKRPALPSDLDTDVRFWKPEEVAVFLEYAQNSRLYALFYTAVMTGMRVGELLGLRWQDLSLDAGYLRVNQNAVQVEGKMHINSPKKPASRRMITISPDTVEVLKLQREKQDSERHNAQEGYQDNDLVFASQVGTVTIYANLRRAFFELFAQIVVKGWQEAKLVDATEKRTLQNYRKLLEQKPSLQAKALLTELNLHGLRHTHASILIRRGVSAKVVSDRLGHTSVAFTLKVYAHLFEEQRQEATISISDFLGSSVKTLPAQIVN
jgi:integrase